jgi:tryptophanyl-tRNA synthetase
VADSQSDAAVSALYDRIVALVASLESDPAFLDKEGNREFLRDWRKQLDKMRKQPATTERRVVELGAILMAVRTIALEKVGFDRRAMKPNPPHGVIEVEGFRRDAAAETDAALARMEMSLGLFGFLPPASTYHRFMGGLQGGKMSSSKPESHISLVDTPEEAAKKLGAAQTGGRATAEEQRRLGGRAEECMVYETYVYHLVPDPKELSKLYEDCKSGRMLCGECKGIAKAKVHAFMKDLREKRGQMEHLVKQVVRED